MAAPTQDEWQFLEILKVYKEILFDFRNVFENRHMFDTFGGYTNTCKGRKCLYKHSLFIINIFITKLLEKRAPVGARFSCSYSIVLIS